MVCLISSVLFAPKSAQNPHVPRLSDAFQCRLLRRGESGGHRADELLGTVLRDMAVDAQRKMYVIMPQKILDLFNVHTALYQTGGVGVAKLVGRDAKGQLRDVLLRLPGGDRPAALLFDALPPLPLRHGTAAVNDAYDVPRALVGEMAPIGGMQDKLTVGSLLLIPERLGHHPLAVLRLHVPDPHGPDDRADVVVDRDAVVPLPGRREARAAVRIPLHRQFRNRCFGIQHQPHALGRLHVVELGAELLLRPRPHVLPAAVGELDPLAVVCTVKIEFGAPRHLDFPSYFVVK